MLDGSNDLRLSCRQLNQDSSDMKPGNGRIYIMKMRAKLIVLLPAMVVLGTSGAKAQYTAKEWPEGPSKQRFVDTCNGCHDINRVRGGYTPEGWLTVVRMMQNMDAPVPAEEWGAMTDYLMKNFPERKRPEAV